ncbi:alkaline phosphatase D family protein [Psychroflexus halocasei]|uniref:Alkaline phosphatase D n=1 Tax=Psychroflexus halocasei TaxID=908615 RepID=A0A1H3YEW5_9FLAO|nr:alkaline phosphatase D family protein [Psychroflexus halocasei]SEA10083.1 alkaline phosphatase D [Psychroflexus halocasei]
MKKIIFLSLSLIFLSCKTTQKPSEDESFKIAFGSCNLQDKDQSYWEFIGSENPDIFIWGGDNIYADTKDMVEMERMYNQQKTNAYYQKFIYQIDNKVYGTWDDHDYGLNDGGVNWEYKDESQQLLLDFLDVKDLERRNRKGVYSSETFKVKDHKIKVIILDTRYFRSDLQKSSNQSKRYKASQDAELTLLGEKQWKWLDEELNESNADYHLIVSSIQVLSHQHGFETWGNFPTEVKKLENLLVKHQVKNPLILSGDRHISEFSQKEIDGLDVPLTDFTSSGLTHAYTSFSGEENQYRVGKVVPKISYGLIEFDFEKNQLLLEIKSTKNNKQLQKLVLQMK